MKRFLILISLLVSLILLINPVYADVNDPNRTFSDEIVEGSKGVTVEHSPTLSSLFVIIIRIVSYAALVGGLVFVAMVAYGVWKSSMALGDPKGLEGAKQTWSYAVFGLFVVIGAYTIFLIIARLFGISSIGIGSFVSEIENALNQLMQTMITRN